LRYRYLPRYIELVRKTLTSFEDAIKAKEAQIPKRVIRPVAKRRPRR
jgi:hypothetical protein